MIEARLIMNLDSQTKISLALEEDETVVATEDFFQKLEDHTVLIAVTDTGLSKSEYKFSFKPIYGKDICFFGQILEKFNLYVSVLLPTKEFYLYVDLFQSLVLFIKGTVFLLCTRPALQLKKNGQQYK